MKKHYETHVEDTDKLISVAGPVLDYKSWYEQYRKLMEEQAQRKYGLYTPTSEGDDDFPSISGMIARYSALGLTNEQMAENPVWKDLTGNGHDLQMKNFAWKEGSGISDIYPGALVFDGVDDYGICENFPILTKEKGYTVVALRQFLGSRNSFLISNRATGTAFSNGAFVFERFWEESGAIFYNFGTPSDQLSLKPYSPFSYLTSKSYNGRATNAGDAVPSNTLLVGKSIINDSNSTNAAVWEICILDHDATEEELQKIQDYYKQEYPWLFPDQAWTVVGKTNEDTDRATIANITGNGNDLVLSNFGFAENSGYGLYAENWININNWSNFPNNATFELTSSTIHITEIKTNRPFLESRKGFERINKSEIKVTGIKTGEVLKLMSDLEPDNAIVIEKDGNYSLPASDVDYYGFRMVNSTNTYPFNCDITIEQIPEYEGYLVTDGVDDKIISSNFKFGENYTVVGEWKFLQEASNVSAGFVKNPNYWILYNYKDGINAYIKADAQGSLISGVRSIKASTSKGDIYPDFNSYVKIEPGKGIESQYALNIAVNSSIFTKLAFKNLAIYPTVLSKEDCIKAYNYLQTLKAK